MASHAGGHFSFFSTNLCARRDNQQLLSFDPPLALDLRSPPEFSRPFGNHHLVRWPNTQLRLRVRNAKNCRHRSSILRHRGYPHIVRTWLQPREPELRQLVNNGRSSAGRKQTLQSTPTPEHLVGPAVKSTESRRGIVSYLSSCVLRTPKVLGYLVSICLKHYVPNLDGEEKVAGDLGRARRIVRLWTKSARICPKSVRNCPKLEMAAHWAAISN